MKSSFPKARKALMQYAVEIANTSALANAGMGKATHDPEGRMAWNLDLEREFKKLSKVKQEMVLDWLEAVFKADSLESDIRCLDPSQFASMTDFRRSRSLMKRTRSSWRQKRDKVAKKRPFREAMNQIERWCRGAVDKV